MVPCELQQQGELSAVTLACLACCCKSRYQQRHYSGTRDPAKGSHTSSSPSHPVQRTIPLRAISGLSTPMGKVKPPVLWLGSRLWHCAPIRAELTGAQCLPFLSGCAHSNKYQTEGTLRLKKKNKKKAFPLPSLNLSSSSP